MASSSSGQLGQTAKSPSSPSRSLINLGPYPAPPVRGDTATSDTSFSISLYERTPSPRAEDSEDYDTASSTAGPAPLSTLSTAPSVGLGIDTLGRVTKAAVMGDGDVDEEVNTDGSHYDEDDDNDIQASSHSGSRYEDAYSTSPSVPPRRSSQRGSPRIGGPHTGGVPHTNISSPPPSRSPPSSRSPNTEWNRNISLVGTPSSHHSVFRSPTRPPVSMDDLDSILGLDLAGKQQPTSGISAADIKSGGAVTPPVRPPRRSPSSSSMSSQFASPPLPFEPVPPVPTTLPDVASASPASKDQQQMLLAQVAVLAPPQIAKISTTESGSTGGLSVASAKAGGDVQLTLSPATPSHSELYEGNAEGQRRSTMPLFGPSSTSAAATTIIASPPMNAIRFEAGNLSRSVSLGSRHSSNSGPERPPRNPRRPPSRPGSDVGSAKSSPWPSPLSSSIALPTGDDGGGTAGDTDGERRLSSSSARPRPKSTPSPLGGAILSLAEIQQDERDKKGYGDSFSAFGSSDQTGNCFENGPGGLSDLSSLPPPMSNPSPRQLTPGIGEGENVAPTMTPSQDVILPALSSPDKFQTATGAPVLSQRPNQPVLSVDGPENGNEQGQDRKHEPGHEPDTGIVTAWEAEPRASLDGGRPKTLAEARALAKSRATARKMSTTMKVSPVAEHEGEAGAVAAAGTGADDAGRNALARRSEDINAIMDDQTLSQSLSPSEGSSVYSQNSESLLDHRGPPPSSSTGAGTGTGRRGSIKSIKSLKGLMSSERRRSMRKSRSDTVSSSSPGPSSMERCSSAGAVIGHGSRLDETGPGGSHGFGVGENPRRASHIREGAHSRVSISEDGPQLVEVPDGSTDLELLPTPRKPSHKRQGTTNSIKELQDAVQAAMKDLGSTGEEDDVSLSPPSTVSSHAENEVLRDISRLSPRLPSGDKGLSKATRTSLAPISILPPGRHSISSDYRPERPLLDEHGTGIRSSPSTPQLHSTATSPRTPTNAKPYPHPLSPMSQAGGIQSARSAVGPSPLRSPHGSSSAGSKATFDSGFSAAKKSPTSLRSFNTTSTTTAYIPRSTSTGLTGGAVAGLPVRLPIYGKTLPWPDAFEAHQIARAKAMTTWDRASAYARRTNELLAMPSGFGFWMVYTIEGKRSGGVVTNSANTFPTNLRIPSHVSSPLSTVSRLGHVRDEGSYAQSIASEATFPMRADAVKAKDLTLSPDLTASPPRTVPPDLPYPGLVSPPRSTAAADRTTSTLSVVSNRALPNQSFSNSAALTRARSALPTLPPKDVQLGASQGRFATFSSVSIAGEKAAKSPSLGGKSVSFFSSLGRKGSKRGGMTGPRGPRGNNGRSSSLSGETIINPLHLTSSPPTSPIMSSHGSFSVMSTSSNLESVSRPLATLPEGTPAPYSGPTSTTSTGGSGSRSFGRSLGSESNLSSPNLLSVSGNGGSGTDYGHSASSGSVRSTFSYGSTLRRSRSPGQLPAGMDEASFEAALEKLADILPHADRSTLVIYLRRAGGSDLKAIGDYLSDESQGQLKTK